MAVLKLKKIIPSALVPRQKSSYYEILAPNDQKLWENVKNTISLGFELIFSNEWVAMVSSDVLPMETFIIDSHSPRPVELFVTPKEGIFIKKGQPIAKFALLNITLPTLTMEGDVQVVNDEE